MATGTLYHYFEHKEQLVNEVYRDAKLRLREALLTGLSAPQLDTAGGFEAWFTELWRRLAAFALREPDSFRFLEMQDHVAYLDAESKRLELSTLAPLFSIGKQMHDRVSGPRIDVVIALMWGAFVGLVKASRLGYLQLNEASLVEAGTVAYRLIEPEATRAASMQQPRRTRG